MKITDLGSLGHLINSILGVKQKEKAEGTGGPESSRAGSGDTIELSSAAQELHKLRKALENLPGDVRKEKVESLQKAIADGTYHIQSEKIADKLINENLLDTTL